MTLAEFKATRAATITERRSPATPGFALTRKTKDRKNRSRAPNV